MAPKGGAPSPAGLLRWPAWALAVLMLASVFAPLSQDFLRGVHLALCAFAVLEAGVSIARTRRAAFFVYAAIAVLANPFRPFVFALQTWRLLHAAFGIWLAADHLSGS